MTAKDVLAFARNLCRDMDQGRPVRYGMHRVVLPLAVPAALVGGGLVATAGCDDSTPVHDETICDNGIDDDGDGAVDCADDACAETAECLDLQPGCDLLREYCEDGVDNNLNGDTDCADICCDAYCFNRDCPGCEYGMPFEPLENETDCADGRDEDCDGLTDCCDPDCSGDSNC